MASPFASTYTDTLALPTDPDQTITIQKLSGRALERAQAAHLSAFIAGKSPRGWAGLFQQALASGTATDADAAKAISDPIAGYDRLSIVQSGVKSWTYADTVKPEAIADLDDEALEYLALAIMRLTKPALFVEAKVDQKNG